MIDQHQQDSLTAIKKQLDKGKLTEVKDTPEYWKKYTTVELDYILSYLKERKMRCE